MAETRFGTFDELLGLADPAMRPIVEQLRRLILAVDPDAVEIVRLGDRAATYGVGPKKMSEGYAFVLPYEHWVNLGFFHSQGLPDPDGLLEGSGARMRHVKVRSLDMVAAAPIRALLEAAVAERRAALGR